LTVYTTWWDTPSGDGGLTPKQALEKLGRKAGLSQGDIFVVLSYASDARDQKLLFGWSGVDLAGVTAYRFLQTDPRKRAPSPPQFSRDCDAVGIRMSSSQLITLGSRLNGLFGASTLTADSIIERVWPSLSRAYGLTEEIRRISLSVLADAKAREITAHKSRFVIAASCIYKACQQLRSAPTQKEIADFIGVSEVSVRNFARVIGEGGLSFGGGPAQ
jgi:Transcription factor TFIIB repeat